jgi:hypothetical protein
VRATTFSSWNVILLMVAIQVFSSNPNRSG